jgi:hypothetical protein
MSHLSRRARTTTTTTGALVAVVLASLALAAGPAWADDDDEVIREGACSSGTDWKVKAKADDGRIELEGEVDSNQNGQTWKWKIKHNGTVSARGSATTTGPSGSFDVERKLTNLAGTDSFVFKARNPGSGETCRGTLAF